MLLWLVRHGECGFLNESDPEPRLTPEGRGKVEGIASRLSDADPRKPEILFCSPLERARETAAVFNGFWDLPIQDGDFLLPHVGPAQVLEKLKGVENHDVALVGHMPNLGLLLATLLWGLPPREAVVPRGAAALLDLKAWAPASAKLLHFIEAS
ncbi:MAG: histidine phosphatase family protein [Deltaproteobacteria bacterium]|nr:histidine phosphatase family protein [Deltaproteobacteria bacterium]